MADDGRKNCDKSRLILISNSRTSKAAVSLPGARITSGPLHTSAARRREKIQLGEYIIGYIRADGGCGGGERVVLPLTSGAAADKSTLIKEAAWSDNYICSLWRVSLQRGITGTPQTPPPSPGFLFVFSATQLLSRLQ